ncbi:MAG TPA: urea ABC transporter permease subunit UrtB [Vicinamibacterales bacterium]|nr:urea ABC transporter permease subunit UrtB [Vicinamibacterales bacterium]
MTELGLLVTQLFNGISLGSILLLAALGLALSFGLMNVINMAHGELLMMGGYVAYLAYRLPIGPWRLPAAMLAATAGTAAFGALLEMTIIRRLYGRPLDTLLATWGVSLVLQQGARSLFGPVGVGVTAPAWLDRSIPLRGIGLPGVGLPVVRLLIIGLAAAVLAALALLLARSRWGRLLRAVQDDRDMAEALGVNSRRVDLVIFTIGTAVAGLAGAALALIAPVTPTVGQSYIVYAFLVVIVGGLGSLTGTVLAALAVGLLSASLQLFATVSTADVLLLLVVMAFIQVRPRGLITRLSRALEEA